MDLRKKKTLRAIREAFYEMRRHKNLEQISVTELAQEAEISKATFYLHYRDIYDLSEQLQLEVIRAVFAKIDNPMEILSHPTEFMRKMVSALESEKENIDPLFSGAQAATLPISIEANLKKYIFEQAPDLKEDAKINVYLSYHILGGYYAYVENVDKLGYKKVLHVIQNIQNASILNEI
ncbi:MAG: TetR/AcrR family transcriptional regulator [Oscillospiraceae bacterium]|nr:TetR/AcrR family transcriptional regulator [Oscillospiraceae bacterium]